MPEVQGEVSLNFINNVVFNQWQTQGMYIAPNRQGSSQLPEHAKVNLECTIFKAGADTYSSDNGIDAAGHFNMGQGIQVDGNPIFSPVPTVYVDSNYGLRRRADATTVWQATHNWAGNYSGVALSEDWRSLTRFTGGLFDEGVGVARLTVNDSNIASVTAQIVTGKRS